MANRIKLENIVGRGYNRITGEFMEKIIEEFVCENCRHLVNIEDKFCWQCGGRLEQSNLIEHYHKGERLTDEEYQRRKMQE